MKDDLIDGKCDINGKERKYIKQWEREPKSDCLVLGVNGSIILKWILKIQSGNCVDSSYLYVVNIK
jgi:hypothetical protein